MTLSPAPATRAPRLTLTQPLLISLPESERPRPQKQRPGWQKPWRDVRAQLAVPRAWRSGNARCWAGRNRTANGDQDNRPAREAGAPRSRNCSSPESGGASEAPLPPRLSRISAQGRAALTRCQRPSPATAAQATAATALYTPGARDRKSGSRTGRARWCREASRESKKPRPRPSASDRGAATVAKGRAGRAAFWQTLASDYAFRRAD